MNKYTCVIDACSFIYMQIPVIASSGDNLEDNTLFDIFAKCDDVTLKVTQEVIDEISDPKKKSITKYNHKYASLLNNAKYKFKKGVKDKLHSGFFENNLLLKNSFGNIEKDDLGEKINFAATIRMFLEGNRSLVFLSDDISAKKDDSILKNLIDSFSMCLYWNTFDAILFLLLIGKKKSINFTAIQAEQCISDIFSYRANHSYRLAEDKFNKNEFNKKQRDSSIEKSTSSNNERKAEVMRKFNHLKNLLN